MEDEDEARQWRTAAVPFGCLGALSFAFIVGGIFLLGTVMGDCGPPYTCHEDDGPVLLRGFAVIALAGLGYGGLWAVLIRALWPPLTRRIGNGFGLLIVGPVTIAAGLMAGWYGTAFYFDYVLGY